MHNQIKILTKINKIIEKNKRSMSFEIDADEVNFPCNFCQRVYPKESERNKHERRHHKDQEKKILQLLEFGTVHDGHISCSVFYMEYTTSL